MPPEDQQEFCPHLYDDLRDSLRAKDQERAIELTYQLICSGRPLGEIIAQTAPDRARPDSGLPEIAPSAAPFSEPPATSLWPAPTAAAGEADETARDGPRQAPAAGLAGTPASAAAPAAARHRSSGWRRVRRAGFLLAYSFVLVLATILGLPLLHRAPPAWLAAAEPSAVAAPTPAVTVPIAPAPAAGSGAISAGERRPAAAPIGVAVAASTAMTAAAAPPDRGAAPPIADADRAVVARPPADARSPANSGAPTPAAAADPAAVIAKRPDTAPAETPRRAAAGSPEIATAVLVARGDALLGAGDLAAARLFYRRGADRGDGMAALRLGESFDPAFLRQAGLGVAAGDATTAFSWYRRARDLGNGDAELLLQKLKSVRR